MVFKIILCNRLLKLSILSIYHVFLNFIRLDSSYLSQAWHKKLTYICVPSKLVVVN